MREGCSSMKRWTRMLTGCTSEWDGKAHLLADGKSAEEVALFEFFPLLA